MLMPLVLGGLLVFIATIIQVIFVVMMIRYFTKVMSSPNIKTTSFYFDVKVICAVLSILFIGHLLQMVMWAVLFIQLGQFDDALTAFYHSAVNFTSLGYGDITMNERWRLLGALEAANGVLMFGLSTGTIFAVMTRLFNHHSAAKSVE